MIGSHAGGLLGSLQPPVGVVPPPPPFPPCPPSTGVKITITQGWLLFLLFFFIFVLTSFYFIVVVVVVTHEIPLFLLPDGYQGWFLFVLLLNYRFVIVAHLYLLVFTIECN